MCGAPAEPLSNVAAVLAFELYKVFAMFGTVFDRYVTAIRTNELLRVEIATCLSLVHSSHTVLSATEVRFLALEALKISIDGHGILFRLSIIGRAFLYEFGVTLFQLFKFQPF